jgi:prophage antirepressor-like protein
MSQVEMFSNSEFELHLTPEGNTFKVSATGLARALGHRDAHRLVESLPEDEKGYTLSCTPGGDQRSWYVTESGFYRALGQRQLARIKNDAMRAQVKRFQNWVYREVLPSLRRTGTYTVSNQLGDEGFREPHTLTWDEVCALLRQRYGIPFTVNQLTRTLRSGGVLKQAGGPRKEWAHLFWFTGSAWNVHPHMVAQLAKKVVDTDRSIQGMRFLQAQLELDGVGSPAALDQRARS